MALFAVVACIFMALGGGAAGVGGYCSFKGYSLPTVAEALPIPIDPAEITVAVNSHGMIFVGSNWIPPEQLKDVLRDELARKPDATVVFSADRRLPFAAIPPVLGLVAALHPRALYLVTEGSASILDAELAQVRGLRPAPLVLDCR